MNRPNLLFLTPIFPHTTGTGSAIRAGVALEALSRDFNVYVLHADIWGCHVMLNMDFVRRLSTGYVHFVPENGELPVPQIVGEHFGRIRFHAIHTFRLVMARAALAILRRCREAQPLTILDLDDDECRRSERYLQLQERARNIEDAQRERKELSRLRLLERLLVPCFHTICLAAREDCERIGQRCPGPKFAHLPNAFFPNGTSPSAGCSGRAPTLLFIGTLNYPPNEDAVGHFCSDILPLIRRKFLHPVRIRIVGAVPSPGIVLLSRRYPDVEVVANVPDLAPYYAEADVVIVPLRAGSGTRIKILEAFSFGRPVVSTTIGAEGLALKNREQLLIADEPEAFAGACVELLEDPALCARITKSAQTWLLAHHSLDRVTGVIRSLYAPVLSPSVTESAWRLDSA